MTAVGFAPATGQTAMEFSEFDALDAGIEPGGLRSRKQIRLLICRIIRECGSSFPKSVIFDVVSGGGLANYFEVVDSLTQMKKTGLLTSVPERNEDELLTLTQLGDDTLSEFIDAVPLSVWEKAIGRAKRMLLLYNNEKENTVKIEWREKEFFVTCTLFDRENVLLCVGIPASDYSRAVGIKERFLTNPTLLYRSVIEALIRMDNVECE